MTVELLEDMQHAAKISILALQDQAMRLPETAKSCERKIHHIINGVRKKELEAAFDAGSAFATGSHKDFQQTHPDKQTYLNSVIKNEI